MNTKLSGAHLKVYSSSVRLNDQLNTKLHLSIRLSVHPSIWGFSRGLNSLVAIEQAGSNEDGVTESACLHAANMLDG